MMMILCLVMIIVMAMAFFNDKKLTSYIMVNKFKSEVFGHHVPMAGIGYVASYPEYRGQGHISKLMKEILKRPA